MEILIILGGWLLNHCWKTTLVYRVMSGINCIDSNKSLLLYRSFGILLWEILTAGQFPFAELSDGEVVQGVCYDFQRLLQPVSCPSEM